MYEQSTSLGEIGFILHNILYEVFGYKENGIFMKLVQMMQKLHLLHIILEK